VDYAVSAFHERSDHMSPVAALMAALLHAATAAALFWVSPLNRHDLDDDAIEVTIEQPKAPEPAQEAVQPPVPPPPQPAPTPSPAPVPTPAVQAAPPPPPTASPKPQPKPEPPARSKEALGVSPPAPVAPEPKKDEAKGQPTNEATAEPPKPEPTKPEPAKPQEAKPQEAKPPEAKPQEAKPQPQEAAAAPPPEPPPPAPEPPVEKIAPPVETPAAPLTMREFVKVLPPPPVPQTPPRPQPPPPQPAPPHQQQALQHSPLSPRTPPPPQTSSTAPGSTFVNPADTGAQTRAKDAYLWQVIRKFSQYLPDLRDKNEGGTVVLRFVIARDGRLVEASIAKSSGVMALDRGMLDSLRAASPYPPLPPEISGGQVVFVQPIAARR
jgi:TonB family protein